MSKSSLIRTERIQFLNRHKIRRKDYVLYWMQASQRAEYNHALEYAVIRANQLDQPLVVLFALTDHYLSANERHYFFMLEGLQEVQNNLRKRGIRMVARHGPPDEAAVRAARKASLVVTDRGYLSLQRKWRRFVARHIDCPLVQVESDVIVPIEQVSVKEEYSAATLRPKIYRRLPEFLLPVRKVSLKHESMGLHFNSLDISDIDKVIDRMQIDRGVGRVSSFQGGTSHARKHLRNFLAKKLDDYAHHKNDPNCDSLSNMSPYLHFGQISPLYIALQVSDTDSPGRDAYLEELIVRRELAINFVFYNRNYASFASLPSWARATLKVHKSDPRIYLYTLRQLEESRTHDPYWNAAQKEMVIAGKMHGYMRMYWGKKILEWCRTPQRAFTVAARLNDKYELDGRDPNGYAGIAWCLGKHDRPWKQRPVFGSIRYMNDKGLQRKFDADAYVEKIENLTSMR